MAKKIIDEREIELTVEALPSIPSEAVQARAKEYFADKDALVYCMDTVYMPLEGRNRKMIRARCTACGEDSYYEACNTVEGCHAGGYSRGIGFVDSEGNQVGCYKRIECERCGASVEAVHTSKIRGAYQIDHLYVGDILNVRGHLALLAWWWDKTVDKHGNVQITYHPNEGVLLVDGTPARVCGYGKDFGRVYQRNKWIKYAKYTDSFGVWSKEEFVYDPNVIYTTDAANCGLDKFITDGEKSLRPGAYLWMWSKCHAVENLVTSGLTRYVKMVIDKCTYTGGYYYEKSTFKISDVEEYIDFKKVKPHEMMRCEKADRNLWHEIGMDKFAFAGFLWKHYGERVSRERLDQCGGEGLKEWKEALRKRGKWLPPMRRTFHYVDREKRKMLLRIYENKKVPKKKIEEKLKEDMRRDNCIIGPRYINDYWNMLEKIYEDGVPEELRFPRDLVEAHDRAQQMVKHKASEALRSKFQKRYEELKPYEFTDEETGLTIRPCETQEEIIREGELLHHCVGLYAGSHAEGRTSIFFIRQIEMPATPYFTLEYNQGYVRQNRGLKNCDRTPDVKAFEEKWLKYIEKIKAKGETNGKHDRNESVRAGA